MSMVNGRCIDPDALGDWFMNTVFFDLDGTLSDPVIGITGSIQYALNALDQDAPSRDALEWCIGPPLLESFETLLGDSAKAAAALSLYRERFSRTGLYENSLYPGIVRISWPR